MRFSIAKTISQMRQTEILIALCVAFLLCCMIIKLIGSAVSPILGEIAEAQSISAATAAVNDAAAEYLAAHPSERASILKMSYADNGDLNLIETNTAYLNLLTADVGRHILAYLKENDCISVKIPIGSLTKNPMLAGRGPRVRVRASAVAGISAHAESSFSSAGFNQSCHRIVIVINFRYKLILPSGVRDVSLSVPVTVAETVIIGDVPKYYS